MMDTSFLVGNAPTPLLSPLEIQARRNALALQQQQLQQNSLALDATRRQMSADAAFRSLFQSAGSAPAGPANALAAPAPASATSGMYDPASGTQLPGAPAMTPAPSGQSAQGAAGMSGMSGSAAPVTAAHDIPDSQILGIYGQQGYGLIHARNEADKLAAETRDKLVETQQKVNDYFGSLAYGVSSVGFDPGAVQGALAKARANGMANTPEFQMFSSNAQNPDALKQLAAQAIANSQEQQKLLNERMTASTTAKRLALEAPGIAAENQTKLLASQGKEPIQPKDQQELTLRAQEIAKLNTEAELADKASKGDAAARRALEMLAETRRASQPQINITPAGYGVLEQQYQQTGQLPAFNRGPGGAVQANIVNGVGAQNPGFNPGAAKADFRANAESLANLQKQRDAVVTFEKTAKANLDQFVNLAAKLPDTGVPWLNQPLRNINKQAVGNAWAPAIDAARQIAVNEIAKVTSNPTLAGALSDSARHEVSEYNPANATYAQTVNVAKVLRQDMANRHRFFDEGLAEIRGRMAGTAAPAAASGQMPVGVPHVPVVGATFNGQKVLSVTRVE
jgi:hypothetical protein